MIRYRVDGLLSDQSNIADLVPAIVSQIKMISGMDIAERRPAARWAVLLHVRISAANSMSA